MQPDRLPDVNDSSKMHTEHAPATLKYRLVGSFNALPSRPAMSFISIAVIFGDTDLGHSLQYTASTASARRVMASPGLLNRRQLTDNQRRNVDIATHFAKISSISRANCPMVLYRFPSICFDMVPRSIGSLISRKYLFPSIST